MLVPRMMIATIVLALAGCTASSQQPVDARPGWRMGAYGGPMMYAGYCPGTADGQARGWYGPGMMGRGGMMGGGSMMSGAGLSGADADAWLADAKKEIGVKAAQEAAWSDYVDAVETDRASVVAMHDQMQALHRPDASAPDRLQVHAQLMAARANAMAQLRTATQTLYQQLTPEQKKKADRALWSGCW